MVARWTCVALLVCGVIVAAADRAAAQAQSTAAGGSVHGVVLDPDGKAAVDAVILVRNEKTSEVRTTQTDDTGHFKVGDLASGSFAIEVAVPGFAIVRRAGVQVTGGPDEDVVVRLTVANVAETVTVSAALPRAAVAAPSQGSLTARSAQSLISNEYIRNYTSPFSDYSQVLQMAPGTFSVSPNGPGLGDTKTYLPRVQGRLLQHDVSTAFRSTTPTIRRTIRGCSSRRQTIGSTVFDRSPGSAATIGPSTYGGSVNLPFAAVATEQNIAGTVLVRLVQHAPVRRGAGFGHVAATASRAC